MRVCIQIRSCSAAMLERLAGAVLLPERPIGAAIVEALHRPAGRVVCVTAPAMADAEDQIECFLRLGMATTEQLVVGAVWDRLTLLAIDDESPRGLFGCARLVCARGRGCWLVGVGSGDAGGGAGHVCRVVADGVVWIY
uniref:hypothetical protein n=1 Tax=Nocardia suismassiliense TaxID=2077092 RepID=UPI003F499C4D